MKLSISLTNKAATKSVGDAPSLKRPAAFGALEDDATDDNALQSARNGGTGNGDLVARNIQSSKSAQKRMKKEQQIDATVYQYDEVWDSMQDAKAKQKEAKERESKERKVSYLTSKWCGRHELTLTFKAKIYQWPIVDGCHSQIGSFESGRKNDPERERS
jgi:coiled-coil domain-containing protein 55